MLTRLRHDRIIKGMEGRLNRNKRQRYRRDEKGVAGLGHVAIPRGAAATGLPQAPTSEKKKIAGYGRI